MINLTKRVWNAQYTFTIKLFFCFSILFVFPRKILSQNLESIGKENPLKVTGSISANQIFYAVHGINERRDPYSYFLSGNLNFDLYGWSVPLSFAYSNQQTSYQQPFNQFGLHPTYKWITGHFGYSSINFSPYTLNGHLFLGAGIEATHPKNFKVAAMYGRLQKSVQAVTDSTNTIINTPAYKRMGAGVKMGYGKEGNFIDLIIFHAKDEMDLLNFIPDSLDVLPQENLVFGLNAGKALGKRVVLTGEYGNSAFTRDIRATDNKAISPIPYPNGLYKPRTTSAFYNAFKSAITYKGNFYSIGLGYERIDPEYMTLGSYYFNNNLENVTVNANTSLLKNKINVGLNIGSQRNNLNNSELSTMRRMVGAINVGLTPNPRLNLSGTYSNFQTFTNIRSQFVNINQLTPYDNLDTLNFTQIAQTTNVNANYIVSQNKDRRQNLNLNLSYQQAGDNQAVGKGSKFYNLNAAYSINFTPTNTSVTLALNGNRNDSPGLNSTTFGPTLGINKSFLEKKLRSSFSSSFNNSYNNGDLINKVLNFRMSGSYTINKKHNINVSGVILNRNTQNMETRAFTEYTCTLGYSYNFGIFNNERKN